MWLFRLGFMVTGFLTAHGQSTDHPNPVTPAIGNVLHLVSELTQQIEELKTFRANYLSTIASLEAKMDYVQLKYQKIEEENRSFGQRIKLLENRPDLPDSSNTAQQMEHEAGTQRSLRKLFVDRDHNRNGMSEDLDRSNYTADTLLVHETNDGGLVADDQSEPESLGPEVRTDKMAEMSASYQLPRQGASVRVGGDMEGMVAFYAQLTSSIYNVMVDYTIKFDTVVTNRGGGYNPTTGVFTCPKSGLYVFSWTTTLDTTGEIQTQIRRNGLIRGWGMIRSKDVYAKDTNIVVLELSPGDVVLVRVSLVSSTAITVLSRWTYFSGFLLR